MAKLGQVRKQHAVWARENRPPGACHLPNPWYID